MKFYKLILFPIILFFSTAHAGTMIFSGNIYQKTCEIALHGNTSGLIVLLHTPTHLPTGRIFGNTPFSIEMKNCATKYGEGKFVAEMIITQENIPNASGTARDVAIRIAKSSSSTINPFSSDVKIDSSGKASISYIAKYYSKGDVTHGSIIGSTSFLVVYN